jgi:hypothetical protein
VRQSFVASCSKSCRRPHHSLRGCRWFLGYGSRLVPRSGSDASTKPVTPPGPVPKGDGERPSWISYSPTKLDPSNRFKGRICSLRLYGSLSRLSLSPFSRPRWDRLDQSSALYRVCVLGAWSACTSEFRLHRLITWPHSSPHETSFLIAPHFFYIITNCEGMTLKSYLSLCLT